MDASGNADGHSTRIERVRGLDAIRTVCAFWVVMYHFGGPPLTAGIDRSTLAGWLIGGVYNNFWNGPAAVIVFFVVSGFCIHYPFSKDLQIPSVFAYGIRRYLRIGIPLAAVMVVSTLLGVSLSPFHDTILWSLVAELVYYTLYPAILVIRRRGVRWRWIILTSFVFALSLVATEPSSKEYPSWGVGLNWVLGLPCWLLGCELAEFVGRGGTKSGSIWLWRMAVWGVSIVLSVLRFHSPVGFPWTLNFFAIMVAFWLAQEVTRYRHRPPSVFLEWCGRWSYSVYLCHVPAHALWVLLPLPNLGFAINWLMFVTFIMTASFLFYLAIESPSHRIAKHAAQALCR